MRDVTGESQRSLKGQRSTGRRLGFLVYDSRSGSTLLASRLNVWAGVSVSHESRFVSSILEFRDALDTAQARRALADVLFAEPHFAELGWTRQHLDDALAAVPAPRTRKAVIEALVTEYFTGRDPDARLWIVKCGRSIFHAQVLREYFPDAFFIQIVRDGRAVHVSKLAARSTAGRMMTDNVVRSAQEWLRKLRIMRLHAEVTRTVRFEDLMRDSEGTLRGVGEFLELSEDEQRPVKSAGDFAGGIGGKQQHLHDKVGKAVDTSRADVWRNEIDPLDARVYDRVAGDELRRWGYPHFDPGPPSRARQLQVLARLARLRLQRVCQSAGRFWGYATQRSLGRRLRGKFHELRALSAAARGRPARTSPSPDWPVAAGRVATQGHGSPRATGTADGQV